MNYKRNILIVLFLAVTSVFFQSCKLQKDEMSAYLMVYFLDETHSLYMAISLDGYVFTDINNGKPIMAGDTIAEQKGIRDPHITRGPDGTFYLTMTDLHIFGKEHGFRDTQWQRDSERYAWGNNRALVLMKSKDLINWERTSLRVDQAFDGLEDIGCAWAPQTIYDEDKDQMMLYYTMRFGNGVNRIYYTYMNKMFTEMDTYPQLLFRYPKEECAYIDGDITKVGDKYHLFYVAHDGGVGIKHAVSNSINGDYMYEPQWIDNEHTACEAPNVWQRIGTDKYVLMYDIYGIRPHNFGFMETSDFETFTDLGHFNERVMKTINVKVPKHGAVVHLTKKEAKRLAKHWGFKIEIK